MKQLRNSLIESLTQTRFLLDTLSSHPNGALVYTGSGIGKHIRHVLDHFLALRVGLEARVIDYNKRNRDSEIERNMFLACSLTDDLTGWMETTDMLSANMPISIISEISCEKTVNARIASNLMREMHYLTYHSIHHLAFCSLLASQEGIDIDPAIGLAPGTATYLRVVNTCA